MLNPIFRNVRTFSDFYETLVTRTYTPPSMVFEFDNIVRAWMILYYRVLTSDSCFTPETFFFQEESYIHNVSQINFIFNIVGLRARFDGRPLITKNYETYTIHLHYNILTLDGIENWDFQNTPITIATHLPTLSMRYQRRREEQLLQSSYYYNQLFSSALRVDIPSVTTSSGASYVDTRRFFEELNQVSGQLREQIESCTTSRRETLTQDTAVEERMPEIDFDPFEGVPEGVYKTLKQAIN